MPFASHADLEITEIMYDHEGTDSGFEWVEVTNTGSSAIEIGSWYFFEAETNHGLTPDGFDTLAPGARALIVQNLQNVYGEFGSSLKLVKASFSLSNTGETLSMSNETKAIVSTVTYDGSIGAAGDGNSLQLISGSWVASSPTPGTENEDSGPNPTPTSPDPVESETNLTNVDVDRGYLNVLTQAVAGSPVSFEAYINHTNEYRTIKRLKGGIYYLSFGDGSYFESEERMETSHVYEYPGTYDVVFEFYSSKMAEGVGEDPKVIVKRSLTVLDQPLYINGVDDLSGITISNRSSTKLDLSGWSLKYQASSYLFERYTYIPGSGSITIPRSVHGLGPISRGQDVLLLNEDGRTASSLRAGYQPLPTTSGLSLKDTADDASPSSGLETTQSRLETFLEKNPTRQAVAFASEEYTLAQTSAPDDQSGKMPIIETVVAITIALGLVGIRAYQRSRTPEDLDSSLEIQGEIELIE
mgnify:CR=1 FL=1